MDAEYSERVKNEVLVKVVESVGLKGGACVAGAVSVISTTGKNTLLKRNDASCQLCHILFPSESYLVDHLTAEHAEHPRVCLTCFKMYIVRNRMTSFPAGIFFSDNTQCVECKGTYFCKLSPRNIKEINGPARDCDFCDVMFVTSKLLVNHLATIESTALAGSKLRRCVYCKTYTGKEWHLRRHILEHIDFKPYVCPVCGGSFFQKSNADQHQCPEVIQP